MSRPPTAEGFKADDASSYDPVVESFERYTDRFSRPLADLLVSLAGLAPGDRVLDVGCGTGVVALAAARGLARPGRVVGIDLSEGMLHRAAARAEEAGLADRTEFRRMDAEALDLPDGSFDACVSLFALMHFPSPHAALAEMRRVLRPGGALVLGVGSGPPLASRAGLARALARVRDALRRWQGRYLSAPGYLDSLVRKYLPRAEVPEESDLARHGLLRPRAVAGLVRGAGFSRVRTAWAGFRACLDTPEEFWELQSTYSSLARKRLAAAPPERVQALRAEFFETCRRVLARGGRLAYPYGAVLVVAEKPRALSGGTA